MNYAHQDSPQAEWGRVAGDWSDRPVFVVGTGNSLKGFDFERLRGLGYVLAVKQAWQDLPFADAVFGLDLPWMEWARDDLIALAGRTELYLAIPEPPWYPPSLIAGATYLKRLRTTNTFSEASDAIESGGNSGFGAVNLAWLKNARRIILLGFDYSGLHYCNDRYEPRPDGHNARYMPNWASNFRDTLPQLKARGAQIVTASPSSLVDAYPRMTIDEAIAWSVDRLGP